MALIQKTDLQKEKKCTDKPAQPVEQSLLYRRTFTAVPSNSHCTVEQSLYRRTVPAVVWAANSRHVTDETTLKNISCHVGRNYNGR